MEATDKPNQSEEKHFYFFHVINDKRKTADVSKHMLVFFQALYQNDVSVFFYFTSSYSGLEI